MTNNRIIQTRDDAKKLLDCQRHGMTLSPAVERELKKYLTLGDEQYFNSK